MTRWRRRRRKRKNRRKKRTIDPKLFKKVLGVNVVCIVIVMRKRYQGGYARKWKENDKIITNVRIKSKMFRNSRFNLLVFVGVNDSFRLFT